MDDIKLVVDATQALLGGLAANLDDGRYRRAFYIDALRNQAQAILDFLPE